ncbi:IS4 family transposase [Halioxenophilus sp. WMMB6]|uniref:IS4 family transposase n=1 Tax=Halioxenophilus sp. WMMB6 TaxID=3073815 RepID=UPI00295F56A8|nr:IS4 family transposase [Halioxenophilus sp. WMMB6]
MNAKHIRCKQQREIIRSETSAQNSVSFFNLLTAPELFDTLEELLPEHRERLFPPTETLSLFLAQAMQSDRSCQRIVNESALSRIAHGLKPCSSYTGAYCRARQRLPTDLVSSLVRTTGRLLTENIIQDWRWQGRSVYIIDGTTVTLPDTPQNQRAYPQQSAQKPGLGFPIVRIVGATCLASGAVLDAAMGPYKGKGGSEHALLRSILPSFKAGDILLGDSLYGSYYLLAECQERSIDVVFEQQGGRKRKVDFRKGKRLGNSDHLIVITKPKQRPDWMSEECYDNLPEELVIRELKTKNKILITTLLSEKETSKHALKELYQSRWHIELDIRNIKTTMGMETLSCRTPEMAEKEMWVYLLAYNLIRIIMAESAKLAGVLPRMLSFKHTVQLWLIWSGQLHSFDPSQQRKLFQLIAQQQVGKRAGRVEPRAIKRRQKPYSLLMKPRLDAQRDIRLHGHPPKQREWNRPGKKQNIEGVCA